MKWDPEQYRRFEAERSAPFDDLIGLIEVRPGMRVIDLGCGAGGLTARLADYLPDADILGVDTSPEMLEQAQQHAGPGLQFEPRGIQDVSGTWDLIVSNAALQWVEEHERLIPRLAWMLEPDGQIAVQVPSNDGHPAYVAIRETALEAPFSDALGGWVRTSPVLSIDAYARLLHRAGMREICALEKVFPHVLPDATALVEWSRGTALRPYMTRLPERLRGPFLSRYSERLEHLYPDAPVFFPFRRTFFSAKRLLENSM